MTHLDLGENEKQALSAALKNYLSDLSYEIADTDKRSFRDELKTKGNIYKRYWMPSTAHRMHRG